MDLQQIKTIIWFLPRKVFPFDWKQQGRKKKLTVRFLQQYRSMTINESFDLIRKSSLPVFVSEFSLLLPVERQMNLLKNTEFALIMQGRVSSDWIIRSKHTSNISAPIFFLYLIGWRLHQCHSELSICIHSAGIWAGTSWSDTEIKVTQKGKFRFYCHLVSNITLKIELSLL